jgi:hypothetical protein
MRKRRRRRGKNNPLSLPSNERASESVVSVYQRRTGFHVRTDARHTLFFALVAA